MFSSMEIDANANLDENIFKMIVDNDDTVIPLPQIDLDPQLLISKVRKYYLEYVIKLLSENYEKNQRLVGKNIYLPSAIWRCAKYIELKAAQACMLVQLYRQNIITEIQQLKKDTNNGKLNKKLFHCLKTPPINDKKIQVNLDSNARHKLKKRKTSPEPFMYNEKESLFAAPDIIDSHKSQPIPTVISSQVQPVVQNDHNSLEIQGFTTDNNTASVNISNENHPKKLSDISRYRQSVESQESEEDQVILQLEQLFQPDETEDLFEGILFDSLILPMNNNSQDSSYNKVDKCDNFTENNTMCDLKTQAPLDTDCSKMQSLDERLALLETSGILKSDTEKVESPKQKQRPMGRKWLCELYYNRLHLSEKLDQVCEFNRKKHTKIKRKFIDLFGEDSDDEQVLSPLEESTDFILSCKERIAPWISKSLTPFYVNGKIKSRQLFKALARYLLKLIIDINRYPSEYEVYRFVTDFVKYRSTIRCEADFKIC